MFVKTCALLLGCIRVCFGLGVGSVCVEGCGCEVCVCVGVCAGVRLWALVYVYVQLGFMCMCRVALSTTRLSARAAQISSAVGVQAPWRSYNSLLTTENTACHRNYSRDARVDRLASWLGLQRQ